MESRSSRTQKEVGFTAVHFTVSGKVHSHRGRGKDLQAPTLNLSAPTNIPDGIYAGWTTIQGQRFMAAVFVGAAITYGETERQLEIHALDTVLTDVVDCSVELVYFVRPNQQFANTEELKEQIAKDITVIRMLLKA